MIQLIGYMLVLWMTFTIAFSDVEGNTFMERMRYLLKNITPMGYLILGVGLYLIGK